MLPKATDGIDAKYIEHEEDIVSYILLPEPALEYFKWRAMAPDQRPETPADLELKKIQPEVKKEPAPAAKAAVEPVAQKQAPVVPTNFQGVASELLEKIEGLTLDELVFRKGEFTIAVRPSGVASASTRPAAVATTIPMPSAAPVTASAPVVEKKASEDVSEQKTYNRTINAPIGGKFYTSAGPGKPQFFKEGDVITAGSKVCIVEAMKLFNEITAPVKCKLIKFLATDGLSVEKDQPLVAIEEV
jgi:acetyl-CoA carboxylase biotin carboxyl carrier protein